jgi:hypothetical protein
MQKRTEAQANRLMMAHGCDFSVALFNFFPENRKPAGIAIVSRQFACLEYLLTGVRWDRRI